MAEKRRLGVFAKRGAFKLEPLILTKKTETFLHKVYPLLKNFPKAEKFCMCQEIKQTIYHVIRDSMMYSRLKAQNRISHLQSIDANLQLLLILFGTARDQHYISVRKALEIQETISELGRICGGLMKSHYGK